MAADAVIQAATIILISLGLLFGFSNGFHDAANAVATVIATKSLTPRQAVYSSALFNFLPCLVQSTAVASTIAKIVNTTCLSSNADDIGLSISEHVLPVPMLAGATFSLCMHRPKVFADAAPQCSLRYSRLSSGIFSRGASAFPRRLHMRLLAAWSALPLACSADRV